MICENCCSQSICDDAKRKECHDYFENEKYLDDKPYSDEEYEDAKAQGLDLDDWNDYVNYFELGEREEYE